MNTMFSGMININIYLYILKLYNINSYVFICLFACLFFLNILKLQVHLQAWIRFWSKSKCAFWFSTAKASCTFAMSSVPALKEVTTKAYCLKPNYTPAIHTQKLSIEQFHEVDTKPYASVIKRTCKHSFNASC